MPFNNDIAGGNGNLVRNWLQSPNFVTGVNGWQIRKDGSVEFNNGTFRGSIEVGSLTGQHFWVNNPNTTDVIDVYNSANKLVFSIDNTGRLVSYAGASTSTIVMNNAAQFFEDTAQTPIIPPEISGSLSATQTSISVSGGTPQNYTGILQPAFIEFITGINPASAWLFVNQRNVQGAVVQNDGSTNGMQLEHAQLYNNIVTDASGNATFNHLCGFTPVVGFLASDSTVGNQFFQYVWLDPPFSATQAKAHFASNTGAPLANVTLLNTYGLFKG